jgi:hypothetical protein
MCRHIRDDERKYSADAEPRNEAESIIAATVGNIQISA